MTKRDEQNPMLTGALVAVLAAVAFGVTTPLIKRFGEAVGPFATAALLYAGAAGASFTGPSSGEALVQSAHRSRLFGVALLGEVLAPATLAWGLQHTSATTASLLLNFEAVFTVLLARAFYAEPIGRRVMLAVVVMVLAGALLVTHGRAALSRGEAGIGALAVLVASLGWAFDNTLTRPLSDLDPASVVLWKASLGAALSTGMAALMHERMPRTGAALALVACGAVGYGASLRLYLLAQRRVGAARTGSIFAVAPFVGAVGAWIMGDRGGDGIELVAGALFVTAIYLHLTEKHRHAHEHEAVEHEHGHLHDDGHHLHFHQPPVAGEHRHWHRHEPIAHDHPHGIDLHHRHGHE
jgi:drug/metabolite transporter (DMT)-like permease